MSLVPPPRITERQWHRAVVSLAETLKWRVFHCARSDLSTRNRTAVGFPDLVLARDGRVLFAELKTATGRLTAEQVQWCDALPHWYLWRPTDWDKIKEILE